MDSLINKLIKKNGFFELTFDNFKDFKDAISPENYHLQKVMINLKFNNEPKETITIPNIGVIELSEQTIKEEIIFRGQANSKWTLTPSLFRNKRLHHLSSPADVVREEYKNILEFQKLCDQAGVQIPGDSFNKRESQLTVIRNFNLNHMQDFWHIDFIETAAFAQHFGFETSFLDWSRNILTASYFACTSAMREFNQSRDKPECFSIWVLNNKYLDPHHVKIVEPPKSINNHISHQNGLLTIAKITPEIANFVRPDNSTHHMAKDFSLESVLSHFKKPHLLLKINVPIAFADDLFNYCNAYNFNACNLFRGAHGVVQHFKDMESLEMFSTQ